MRRAALVLAFGGALLSLCSPAAASPARPYIVVYKDHVPDVNAVTAQLQTRLRVNPRFRYESALKGFAAELSSAQLSALRSDPQVSFIAPDTIFKATGMQPLASGEMLPVGIRRIGAATTTQVHAASGVAVAELDTGIDLSNADLNAVSGTNCITRGASARDDNGHGTNVAGIIAAGNRGGGVVGVAPGTKLYAVKVLDKRGVGTLSQVLCGIDWVTANAAPLKIKVANMSLAGYGFSDNNCGYSNGDAEHRAICNSTTAGVTYVAAAGNSSTAFSSSVPAAYREVLTVTAINDTDGIPGGLGGPAACLPHQPDDAYANFSNYALTTSDQTHTIAAPGTCVVSDGNGGGTSTYYGTSQAAPHVAGTVALCIDDGSVPGPCSGLPPAQVIATVRSHAAAAGGGFNGDPAHPVVGKYFGYLVSAAGY